jgi:hypothetical protein
MAWQPFNEIYVFVFLFYFFKEIYRKKEKFNYPLMLKANIKLEEITQRK